MTNISKKEIKETISFTIAKSKHAHKPSTYPHINNPKEGNERPLQKKK